MNQAENPIYMSFPVGTWFATRIRISVFFPVLVLYFAMRVHDISLGLIIGGVLFGLILVHEYAHIFAARLTGGYGEEILIWPLGGLAFCHPGYSFKSRLLTPAAGPIFHALFCLVLLYPMLQTGQLAVSLNPLSMGELDLSPSMSMLSKLVIITFSINWILLLLNLIPVYPLDGGRVLQTLLSRRLTSEGATQLYIRIGVIFGFGFLLIGMFVDNTMVVCLGAMVLVLNMQESFRMQSADNYDDSFMGYDFSQGYTSLEKDTDAPQLPKKSAFVRWREKRATEKAEREIQQAADEEQQVDTILAKLHQEGRDALSAAEHQLLKRVSDRLRNKERGV